MKHNWKRSLALGLAILMVVSLVLVGCAKTETPTPAPVATTPGTATTTGGTEVTPAPTPEVTPTPVPSAPVKISVMQWDRGNAPAGWSEDKAFIYRYTKEENLKQYVEVEFFMTPRSGSDTNVKTLYAAQSNPTIVYTYEINLMTQFADEGGLWALDDYIDTYAADLRAKNALAYDQTGGAIYKGHQYFVPGMRTQPYGGASNVIRQDWLDELNLPMPTTMDELYDTLVAFRDGTPGITTKDTIVPWALQAPTGWFLYHLSENFGMSTIAPLTGFAYKGGVIRDNTFTPAVLSDEFKELCLYLNKAYANGLLDKELITDTAYERYNMFFARAVTGFTESNNDAWTWTEKGLNADPNTRFADMEPMFLKDGTQASIAQTSAMAMFIMIPKATATEEQAIAALKFMNWQSSVGWEGIFNGVEGEHFIWTEVGGDRYRVTDYEKISKTKEERDIDMWSNGDMVFVQQGQGYDSLEVMIGKYTIGNVGRADWSTVYPGSDPVAMAEFQANAAMNKRIIHETFGLAAPVSMEPRPHYTEKISDINTYVNDGVATLMLSTNFDADLEELIDGFKAKGGMEVSDEAAGILRSWGYIN